MKDDWIYWKMLTDINPCNQRILGHEYLINGKISENIEPRSIWSNILSLQPLKINRNRYNSI